MNAGPVTLRKGIVQFPGKISRNMLVEPMASHTYLLEDGDQVVIFDPSCGKKIARQVEAYIRDGLASNGGWKQAIVVAGHSHMDHANNFYLGELLGAEETHVYVHESGFQAGRVLNEPFAIYQKSLAEWSEAYNPYLAYYFPYILLTAPFAPVHALSPVLARKLFSAVGAIPWPRPRDGTIAPEPLREADMAALDLGGIEVRGWSLGGKVVLPTPGHSLCSVSLLWPERKALFVSDAVLLANPMFMTGSFEDCITSMETLKKPVEAGKVDLLLPAHGQVWEGRHQILRFLDLHLRSHEVARNEIRSAYRATGGEKDVRRLTRFLASESPYFRLLKQSNYPPDAHVPTLYGCPRTAGGGASRLSQAGPRHAESGEEGPDLLVSHSLAGINMTVLLVSYLEQTATVPPTIPSDGTGPPPDGAGHRTWPRSRTVLYP